MRVEGGKGEGDMFIEWEGMSKDGRGIEGRESVY